MRKIHLFESYIAEEGAVGFPFFRNIIAMLYEIFSERCLFLIGCGTIHILVEQVLYRLEFIDILEFIDSFYFIVHILSSFFILFCFVSRYSYRSL
ncbi:Uncharacterised protein [Segatella copri]|nr:Uncharacterised protein [Segatella copri]